MEKYIDGGNLNPNINTTPTLTTIFDPANSGSQVAATYYDFRTAATISSGALLATSTGTTICTIATPGDYKITGSVTAVSNGAITSGDRIIAKLYVNGVVEAKASGVYVFTSNGTPTDVGTIMFTHGREFTVPNTTLALELYCTAGAFVPLELMIMVETI
jgi:hypothetical protein